MLGVFNQYLKITNNDSSTTDFIGVIKNHLLDIYNMKDIDSINKIYIELNIDGHHYDLINTKESFRSDFFKGFSEEEKTKFQNLFCNIEIVDELQIYSSIEVTINFDGGYERERKYVNEPSRYKKVLNKNLADKVIYKWGYKSVDWFSEVKLYVFEVINGRLVQGFQKPLANIDKIDKNRLWKCEVFFYNATFGCRLPDKYFKQFYSKAFIPSLSTSLMINTHPEVDTTSVNMYLLSNIKDLVHISTDSIIELFSKVNDIHKTIAGEFSLYKPTGVFIVFTDEEDSWSKIFIDLGEESSLNIRSLEVPKK